MGLQIGRDKCVKMHVGKTRQNDICTDCKVDAWKDVLLKHEDGHEELKDTYLGEEVMKNVHNKKYLGSIISNDMGNKINIVEKTNRGVGIVNKIRTTLIERPYGKYTYKAAALMREGLLLSSMLNNSESWIDITKQDIEKLEKPDKILIRSILGSQGNPSTVFMYLELGFLPVKYVIMKKRLNFLKYILNENMNTMLRKVYEVLKTDSRKGDFVDLVQHDLNDLEIELSENEIQNTTKVQWKRFINIKVKEAAFQYLIAENNEKSKTKHINFDSLQMSKYLAENKSTALSKTILSVRSGTLDLKVWNSLFYENTLCVMCKKEDETIEHFMTCNTYGKTSWEIDWKEIFLNHVEKQNTVAKEVKRRQFIRQKKLDEVGLPPILAPLLQ